MNIHKANKLELEEFKSLWNQEFHSSYDYIENFLNKTKSIPYVLTNNNEVVSCLTLVNAGIYSEKTVFVSYAVCTKKDQRNKGYGSKIVSYINNNVINNNNISLLCPSNIHLIDFYKRNGYFPACYITKEKVNVNKICDQNIKMLTTLTYQQYREKFLEHVEHIKINKDLLDFISSSYGDNAKLLSINNAEAICIFDDRKQPLIYDLILNPKINNINYDKYIDTSKCVLQHYGYKEGCVKYLSMSKDIKNTKLEAMINNKNVFNNNIYYGIPME